MVLQPKTERLLAALAQILFSYYILTTVFKYLYPIHITNPVFLTFFWETKIRYTLLAQNTDKWIFLNLKKTKTLFG